MLPCPPFIPAKAGIQDHARNAEVRASAGFVDPGLRRDER